MSRIFVTGDSHYRAEYTKVEALCELAKTSKEDFLIILGDHGCNFYGEKKDRPMKKFLESLPISFVLLKGNHDQRPSRKTCELKMISEGPIQGEFWIDSRYPHIWYPKIFGAYNILGKGAYMIGGAYSVDKFYRLEQQALGHKGWRWFYDEQLSKNEMARCEKEILELNKKEPFEWVFSHTCPAKFAPYDKFLTSVDQGTVDNSMELWMDVLEEKLNYENWMFGHYHTDRIVDILGEKKVRCMYNDAIQIGVEITDVQSR